jgi:hypothetical protein
MFRGLSMIIAFVAILDVYVMDGRHVNAAMEIWGHIARHSGF